MIKYLPDLGRWASFTDSRNTARGAFKKEMPRKQNMGTSVKEGH